MMERSTEPWWQGILQHGAFVSLLGAALLFAVCLAVLQPRYVVNDDLKIISVLAGYPAGNPAPFPIYSNVLLGLLLVPLYSLQTVINWEIMLFLLGDFLSIWALTFIAVSGSPRSFWRILATGSILISGSYFALNITFTNAAGLACFAGLCLLLFATRPQNQDRHGVTMMGIALVLLGSLIRIQMLVLSLPIVMAALIFLVRSLQVRRLLVYLVCAAAIVAAGMGFDRLYVRAHPDWNTYYFYNATAQQLRDAHRLGNAGAIIKRISWSKNDQELFARSFFPDADIFSIDRIKYLNEHVPATSKDTAGEVRTFLQRLVAPSGLPIVLLITSLWLLVLSRRPSLGRALAATAVTAVSLAENTFLAWLYKNPDWSLFTLLSTTAMLLALLLAWPDEARPRASPGRPVLPWLAVLLVVVAVGLISEQAIAVSNDARNKELAYHQLLADISRLQADGRIVQDAVIISPSHGIPWEWSNPLILDLPRIPFLDTGYITFSPFYERALDKYGLRPLPEALYTKPNVYLMTQAIFQQYLAQYYREHGNIAVVTEIIYTMPNLYNAPEYVDTQLYKVVPAK